MNWLQLLGLFSAEGSLEAELHSLLITSHTDNNEEEEDDDKPASGQWLISWRWFLV